MKKVKQALAFLLALCLLGSLIPAAALAEEPEETAACIAITDFNEAYVRLFLEQEGKEALDLNANTNYPVPEGSFSITAEITEAGLRDRYPFYSNALLVITPTGAEDLSFAASANGLENTIGTYTFSAEEAAPGFQVEVTEHNRPLVNEFRPHYPQENGGRVFFNGAYMYNEEFGRFETGESVTLSFPEGQSAYKVAAVSVSTETEITPNSDGTYTYTFSSAAGITFEIYWTEEEYRFQNADTLLNPGFSLYDLLLDGAGSEGTVEAVGLSEDTDYYIIGSRFNRTAVAIADSVSSITLRVLPAEHHTFREAFVGDLTFTELDADGCFTFETSGNRHNITVYFDSTAVPSCDVYGFDNGCFTLSINEEAYCGRSFTPEAGKVIQAGLTERGAEEGRFLKGLILWMYDGSVRYLGAKDNTIDYTITAADAACGFNIELAEDNRPFAGEFRADYAGANDETEQGRKVWLLTESGRQFLRCGEVYSIPDGPLTLLIESDSLYDAEPNQDGTGSYALFPGDPGLTDNKDGTWTLSLTPGSDAAVCVNILMTESEYRYEHPNDFINHDNEVMMNLWSDPGRGTVEISTASGWQYIGSRFGDSAYAIQKDTKELTLRIVPLEGFTYGDVRVNGELCSAAPDGSVTITIPGDENGPYDRFNVDVFFNELLGSRINGYDEELYQLTVGGVPLCGEDFLPKAGQIIRAGLTERGKEEDCCLKGLVIFEGAFTYYVPVDETGTAAYTITDQDVENGFSVEVVQWNRPFAGEFCVEFDGAQEPDEEGSKVWLDQQFVRNGESYPLPEKAFTLTIEADSLYDAELCYDGYETVSILPGEDGLSSTEKGVWALTVTPEHDSALFVTLHMNKSEHDYDHREENFDCDTQILMELWVDNRGTAEVVSAEGISFIGSRYDRAAYAINKNVKTVSLSAAPNEGCTFGDIWVNEELYSAAPDGCVAINIPGDENGPYDRFNVDVHFEELPRSRVGGYDDERYLLTIDGVPYRDDEFIPVEGQVIQAGLTNLGITEDFILKGLIIWLHDENGSVRYIRPDEYGDAAYTVSASDAASAFDVELVVWDRPFAGEFSVEYMGAYDPEEDGAKVWRVTDDGNEFLRDGSSYEFGAGFLTLQIESDELFQVELCWDGYEPIPVTPGSGSLTEGENGIRTLTAAKKSGNALIIRIYQTEDEYKYSHADEYIDHESQILMNLWADSRGSVEVKNDDGIAYIGSRYDSSAYAINKNVKTVSFSVVPDEGCTFGDIWVNGELYSAAPDGSVTINIPGDENGPYDGFNVDVFFEELAHSWVNGYDSERYFLTVDGEPICDDEFIPAAGQVIRAGLTEKGIEEDRFLKGLVIWVNSDDGTVRYVRTNEDGIAEYAVTDEDADRGFSVELTDWDRPYAGEYAVHYDGSRGAAVWVQGNEETILESDETYTIPDDVVHFETEDDIYFHTLVLKSGSIYAVRISTDNYSFTLMPENLDRLKNEDGTWSIRFCAIDIDEETSTFTNVRDDAYFLTIWWDQEAFEFDEIAADYENGEYFLGLSRLDLSGTSPMPEFRYDNLTPVSEVTWYNDEGKQILKKAEEEAPSAVSIRFPDIDDGITVSVFLNGDLSTDYGDTADADGWITLPYEADDFIILITYPGNAAVVAENIGDMGYCGMVTAEFIAPLIPEGTFYYAMLFYGVNKENFVDTITTSLDDVNDFTEARWCALGNNGEHYYSCDFYNGGMVPETEYYAKVVLFLAGEEGNAVVGASAPFVFTTQPFSLDAIEPDVPVTQNEIGYKCYTFTPDESGWYEISATNADFLETKDKLDYVENHKTTVKNSETGFENITTLFYAEKDTTCYLYIQQAEESTASDILLTARPIKTTEDTATGITAEADEDLTLVVDEVEAPSEGPAVPENPQDEAVYEAAADILDGENADFVLFNVTLVNSSNEEQQPAGAIMVSIPVPAGYDAEFCVIYHVTPDGTAIEIQAEITIKNNVTYLTFVTTHLSYYALVYQPEYDIGDINGDGKIDLIDVSLLFRWWNGQNAKLPEERADINEDTAVDLRDAAALYRTYLARTES